MSIRIGINGYGRIGRNFHRLILEQGVGIEVVAINTRSDDLKMRAHLLKYDSLHGKLDTDIHVEGNDIYTDGIKVQNFSIKNIDEIPWKNIGVDLVLECTGEAKNSGIAMKHISSGAKKVLVSAPMKDDTKTIVLGVNDDAITAEDLVLSNASCTTNCIAPPLKIIEKNYGINYCYVNSIHSFTNSQNLLDNTGKDLRRARSAVQSVIPTTSGAMDAIGKVLPELLGKVDGIAVRVPIATSSVCECVIHLNKPTTKEEFNELFRTESKKLRGGEIIGVADEELVSIDFKTDTRSSILDPFLTKVDKSGKYIQIMLWYDNEWAYAKRLVDVAMMWMVK